MEHDVRDDLSEHTRTEARDPLRAANDFSRCARLAATVGSPRRIFREQLQQAVAVLRLQRPHEAVEQAVFGLVAAEAAGTLGTDRLRGAAPDLPRGRCARAE